ncbi:nuclear transport factor 2 family protein [Hyphococcus luteus]|uniref:DUF4440 domain-containing protein n=1 Tax=Hyphococcus luteus TaxID=2058213 RepID=A0A2S7JZA7_9PROT|nr:nuclear transport factor 2 family protein [Marinicaulis flavus]PQA85593.1 hypothetical protein CW354_21900 [Marinicaulis flavus]
MKRKGLFLLGAAALLAACAEQPATEPSVDHEAAIAEIDALRSGFERAVAEGDMAALGALVTPEAIMLQPGSADWKAMQALAAGAPFPPGAEIRITPFETKIVNATWAFERGASLVAYADPASGDEIVLRDAYLLIFRNDGEGWRLHREVASASEPPEGWPAAD